MKEEITETQEEEIPEEDEEFSNDSEYEEDLEE